MAMKRFWGIPEILNSAETSPAMLDQGMMAGPLPQRAMAATIWSDGSAWAATTSSISTWPGAPGAAGRSSSADARSQVRQVARLALVSWTAAVTDVARGTFPAAARCREASGTTAAVARPTPIRARRETRAEGVWSKTMIIAAWWDRVGAAMNRGIGWERCVGT